MFDCDKKKLRCTLLSCWWLRWLCREWFSLRLCWSQVGKEKRRYDGRECSEIPSSCCAVGKWRAKEGDGSLWKGCGLNAAGELDSSPTQYTAALCVCVCVCERERERDVISISTTCPLNLNMTWPQYLVLTLWWKHVLIFGLFMINWIHG